MLPLYVLLIGILVVISIFTLPTIIDDWKKSRLKKQ